jgi:nucleoside-diphosphate-sugar epimerase
MSDLIIGCGYIGLKVTQALQKQGHHVTAVTRSTARKINLLAADISTEQVDLDDANASIPVADNIECLYYFAPPPAKGQTDLRIQRALSSLSQLPKRIVLISTTGVYGDCQGAWIDETQALNPQADRAKRRVDAEVYAQQWAKQQSIDCLILRVAGIYGAGRLPLKRLQNATPVLDASIAPFSNRIHADDLVAACLAAGQVDKPAGIYHLSDGNPSTMTDYFNQVADAAKLPRPPCLNWHEAQDQLSPEMLSYLSESKRLDTRKMREILGVIPRYPTLKLGLLHSMTS